MNWLCAVQAVGLGGIATGVIILLIWGMVWLAEEHPYIAITLIIAILTLLAAFMIFYPALCK